MRAADTRLDGLDWAGIGARLDGEGYALLPGILAPDEVDGLAQLMGTKKAGATALAHEAHSGRADLFCLGADLPAPLGVWREAFYGHLAVIANRWNEYLGNDDRYPAALDAFLRRNEEAGQRQGQSFLSRLGVDADVPLHQRNAGEHVFPLQIVVLLSTPGSDFHGGEFVMIEQRPRMQSRPLVLPLNRGDAAIIATAQRPVKGSRGYYRVNLRHAISRVRRGERIGLELLFHNAP